MYNSVLQHVAVCCSVTYVYGGMRKKAGPKCVAVSYYSVLQCVAVCCSVLPCVAVRCNMLQRVAAS